MPLSGKLFSMPTMLPAAPKTLGRLSDVLKSALDALSGQANALHLKSASSAAVILVDGLGSANLKGANSHARFINSIATNKSINTVFPTTTAAALTSFATGLQPTQHGFIGYRVFDRKRATGQNLLSGWTSYDESSGWRAGESLSTIGARIGIASHFIGSAAYQRSGFTNVIMPDATFHPADRLADRFRIARELIAVPGNLVYLYVPELDQTAHASGSASFDWLNRLEDFDAQLRDFTQQIPKSAGVLLTADHGIVDVPKTGQIELGELALEGLEFFGGDTRNAYLYFSTPDFAESAKRQLGDHLGELCWVASVAELREARWLGEPAIEAAQRLPDLFVIARKKVAIYHRRFSSVKSYNMVGHHGSISPEEVQIPLIQLGVWAN